MEKNIYGVGNCAEIKNSNLESILILLDAIIRDLQNNKNRDLSVQRLENLKETISLVANGKKKV